MMTLVLRSAFDSNTSPVISYFFSIILAVEAPIPIISAALLIVCFFSTIRDKSSYLSCLEIFLYCFESVAYGIPMYIFLFSLNFYKINTIIGIKAGELIQLSEKL